MIHSAEQQVLQFSATSLCNMHTVFLHSDSQVTATSSCAVAIGNFISQVFYLTYFRPRACLCRNARRSFIPSAEGTFFLWRCDQKRNMASSILMFLYHKQRRTLVGRTPLDEWSARRRELYLTTHNTHNRRTFMPLEGFEPKSLRASGRRITP
jgi:hypothetical protein